MIHFPVLLTTLLNWGSRTSHWWYKVGGLQHNFWIQRQCTYDTVPPPLHGPIWDLLSLLSKLLDSIVAMHSQTQPTPILLMERKILYNHELSTHLGIWQILFLHKVSLVTQSLFPLSITSPSTSCFSLSLFPSPSLRPPYTLSLLVLSPLFPPYALSFPILSPSLYSLLFPSPSPLSSSSWSGGQHHSEIRKSQLEENTTNLECTRRQ